jgi:hypothetical protein
LVCEKGGPLYAGGSHDATAAQSPDSVRMALWCADDVGLETESQIPLPKCCVRRAWVIGDGMLLLLLEGQGYGGGMESVSQMKAVVRAVLWKAEAISEMNLSRNSGLGVEVVVVGGRG